MILSYSVPIAICIGLFALVALVVARQLYIIARSGQLCSTVGIAHTLAMLSSLCRGGGIAALFSDGNAEDVEMVANGIPNVIAIFLVTFIAHKWALVSKASTLKLTAFVRKRFDRILMWTNIICPTVLWILFAVAYGSTGPDKIRNDFRYAALSLSAAFEIGVGTLMAYYGTIMYNAIVTMQRRKDNEGSTRDSDSSSSLARRFSIPQPHIIFTVVCTAMSQFAQGACDIYIIFIDHVGPDLIIGYCIFDLLKVICTCVLYRRTVAKMAHKLRRQSIRANNRDKGLAAPLDPEKAEGESDLGAELDSKD